MAVAAQSVTFTFGEAVSASQLYTRDANGKRVASTPPAPRISIAATATIPSRS